MKSTLIFSLLIVTSYFLTAQEISQWRGENRDGIYKDTGLLDKWPADGPELLWHFDDLGDGHASAAVTSDRIYIGGTLNELGYIFALDHNGNLIWETQIGKSWTDNWNGVRSTPLVVGDKVYFMSAFGRLVCLKTSDGSTNWEVDLFKQYGGINIRWGVTENLLFDDNKLFVTVGGKNANVIALNRNTGDLIWECEGNGEISAYNSPLLISLAARKLVVTMSKNSVLGFDA